MPPVLADRRDGARCFSAIPSFSHFPRSWIYVQIVTIHYIRQEQTIQIYLTGDWLALRILESSLEEELLLPLLLCDPELDEELDAVRRSCFELDLLRDLEPGRLGEHDLCPDLERALLSDWRDAGLLGDLKRDPELLLSLDLSASPPRPGLRDLLVISLSLTGAVDDVATGDCI